MKRQKMESDRARKECLRAVRFLASGAGTIRKAAKEGRLLLDGGERGVISISAAALCDLQRAALVGIENGVLALTPEGRALTRRASAKDEPFREQHIERGTRTDFTEDGPETVEVNLSESPLGQLARRRGKDGRPFLDEAEFRAGERLRADFTRGQIMPRLGASWSEPVNRGKRGGRENGIAELTEAALAARQRVEHALAAVGPELAGVLVDVCCFLKGLERVEAERGWPVRSAKVVLKTALAALSRHYEPPPRPRRQSVLHWGAEDYRPRLRT
ncbi:DUF6456 domain-containing protein [Chelativorans sp. YIM 93263]|uniref:DUF6456 domain-containing protein n=1 Tax=Chelativorans sp. YIM 93263 TaxID=2906648 RepID=UPI00237958DE|nr:DUF6456 domain-containing protein [Chelativorans sp. YIM 93263]